MLNTNYVGCCVGCWILSMWGVVSGCTQALLAYLEVEAGRIMATAFEHHQSALHEETNGGDPRSGGSGGREGIGGGIGAAGAALGAFSRRAGFGFLSKVSSTAVLDCSPLC